MYATRRLVGTALSALGAAVFAGLVGAPAGTTAARAAAAEGAEAAEAQLAADGVLVVDDDFVPPAPDCDLMMTVSPLRVAGFGGAPTPRDAALAHAVRPYVHDDVDPHMVVVEVGRVRGGDRHETWALVHAGGSVTTLPVGVAPAGGWYVEGSQTCVVRPD